MEKPPEKWERKADVRRGLREGISMLFLRRREPPGNAVSSTSIFIVCKIRRQKRDVVCGIGEENAADEIRE